MSLKDCISLTSWLIWKKQSANFLLNSPLISWVHRWQIFLMIHLILKMMGKCRRKGKMAIITNCDFPKLALCSSNDYHCHHSIKLQNAHNDRCRMQMPIQFLKVDRCFISLLNPWSLKTVETNHIPTYNFVCICISYFIDFQSQFVSSFIIFLNIYSFSLVKSLFFDTNKNKGKIGIFRRQFRFSIAILNISWVIVYASNGTLCVQSTFYASNRILQAN